ncbi:MAG TPA: TRAP transporter substrate-binding protein DctP [Ferrovibrio sp.]|uniref:TRAP transporter substrate-binding protein n=1 Tax=Ferrovibrio sp. TaxID=1917215 RepID=UPI002B4B7AF1|nr:TRAP transporter substrate-binding protein DctP [Ferrovibrio sp.]HLT79252.1 TRAP transporter substrate-binding protein DctP [Ferrovibrio sp.]
MNWAITAFSVSIGIGTLLMTPIAAAQGKIKIKLADSFPAGHFTTVHATQPFMEKVKAKTNGAVEFEYFPAEQLGKAKDMLQLLQSGLTDIAYVAPPYITEKLPLSAVATLPGGAPDACSASLAYEKLAIDGLLYQNEFKPNRVKPLYVIVTPPYALLTKTREVTSLEQAKGLKVRGAGAPVEAAMKSVGLVPVRISAPETHESLMRGTIDGVMFPLTNVKSYDLQGLLRSATKQLTFGAFVGTFSVSDQSWNRLPPDIRKALTKAGEETTREVCQAYDNGSISAQKDLESAGIKFVDPDKSLVAAMQKAAEEVGGAWAKELDGRGKAGSAVLKAYTEAVQAQKK